MYKKLLADRDIQLAGELLGINPALITGVARDRRDNISTIYFAKDKPWRIIVEDQVVLVKEAQICRGLFFGGLRVSKVRDINGYILEVW
jgi:hypothetical protein